MTRQIAKLIKVTIIVNSENHKEQSKSRPKSTSAIPNIPGVTCANERAQIVMLNTQCWLVALPYLYPYFDDIRICYSKGAFHSGCKYQKPGDYCSCKDHRVTPAFVKHGMVFNFSVTSYNFNSNFKDNSSILQSNHPSSHQKSFCLCCLGYQNLHTQNMLPTISVPVVSQEWLLIRGILY